MAAVAAWQQLAKHADLTAGAAPGGRRAAEDGSPESAASAERLTRATRALRLGDSDAAVRLLDKEIEEEPESYLALDLRAAAWLQLGRHERALDDAMLATKLNPDWARGWARLGAAQLCLGHARPAAAAYRRGLELEGGSREMRLGLELAQKVLAAQGDRRKAMRHE